MAALREDISFRYLKQFFLVLFCFQFVVAGRWLDYTEYWLPWHNWNITESDNKWEPHLADTAYE
jgi:hypothetical protein